MQLHAMRVSAVNIASGLSLAIGNDNVEADLSTETPVFLDFNFELDVNCPNFKL